MTDASSRSDETELQSVFGTKTPLWNLRNGIPRLEFPENVEVAVELSSAQVEQVRALSPGSPTANLEVLLQGKSIRLHLIGRKADNDAWSGRAAAFSDMDSVAKNFDAKIGFTEQIIGDVNSLIVVLDSKGLIRRFNRQCELATGYLEVDLIGKDAHALFAEQEVADACRETIANSRDERTFDTLRKMRGLAGERLILWRNTRVAGTFDDGEEFLICSGTDVTEEHEAKVRLSHLASHDSLTGLPNRFALSQAIFEMSQGGPPEPFSLLYLGLDRFKYVNDNFGHSAGDEVLKRASSILRLCLEQGDKLFRFESDQFVILVQQANSLAAEVTALKLLKALKRPFAVGCSEVHITASIGISMFPSHGNTFETLIRSADAAMHNAKVQGLSEYMLFNEGMDERRRAELWLDAGVRTALKNNEFELVYQPKVDLHTGQTHSVEALIRWNHPERGVICPDQFIPFAEQSGHIVAIGQWVIREGAKQAGIWKKAGRDVRIAVNVSAKQLLSPTLMSDFTEAILRNDLTPSTVDLELTESCLIADEKVAHQLIRTFREIGAEVHLDDFGTGHSSLSQLARLTLDVLKLDASFIKAIHTDAKSRTLVQAMVAVGHELKLKVVAEGVETKAQVDFLTRIGVDYAQGFFYSKGLCAKGVEDWLDGRPVQVLSLMPKLMPQEGGWNANTA